MTNVKFNVPYSVGWRGTTYLPGIQTIPEELAQALGYDPNKEQSDPLPQKPSQTTSKTKTRTPPSEEQK
jgi:hypothetical protein